MRFEEKGGVNGLRAIQARQIATGACQYAISVLKRDLSDDLAANQLYDSKDEIWFTLFAGTAVDVDKDGTSESRWIYVHQNADGTGPIVGRFAVYIEDEASKLNLNAAGAGAQNQGVSPYEFDLTRLPGIDSTLANAVVAYRLGDNAVQGADATGNFPLFEDDNNNNKALSNDGIDNDGDGGVDEIDEGKDEPAEFDPEMPYEDDRPFSSVEELVKVAGVSADAIPTLRKYLTVWSYDMNLYWNGSGWARKININHVASVAGLRSLILADNIYRMTANIVDYGDRDVYPTVISEDGTVALAYLGIESLQFNEVMTDSGTIARTHLESLVPESPWTDQILFDQGTNNNDTGHWQWNWDNGVYEIRIEQANGTNISVNGTAIPDPDDFTPVTITNNTIDLYITDPQDFTALLIPIYATFTRILIKAGKYIEIIHIGEKAVTLDNTGSDAWQIRTESALTLPAVEGMSATAAGGTIISLDEAWNQTSDVALAGLQPQGLSAPIYDYLVIADSLYALDALHGDGDGEWAGDADEPGTVLAVSGLQQALDDDGSDLFLTDSDGNVIAFAPASTQAHITGYATAILPGQGVARVSPVDQATLWLTALVPTPGQNNVSAVNIEAGQNRYWGIKNRPYASVGELGDVFKGTSPNETYSLNYLEIGNYENLGKMTVSAKRIEAEDADSTHGWSAQTAFLSDGTTQYVAPSTGGTWTWTWTFDATDSTHAAKPFRFRNAQNYEVLAYGQFLSNFESPGGNSRTVRPNHSVELDPVSVSNERISIEIAGNGIVKPKLDFIVLTPEPYTWGRVNVNTASQDVLLALPGMGSSLVGNILSYLASNQNIRHLQQLTAITGIGEGQYKPVSNLLTVRSDVYRIMVRAEVIRDLDGNGAEGDASDVTAASADMEIVVDRNPSLRFPGSSDRYRVEYQKYVYQE